MKESNKIEMVDGKLIVPDAPVIPFVKGDGIGQEIWQATVKVIDAAIKKAFSGQKQILWKEYTAGESAARETGEWLPQETLQAFKNYKIGIKGPLTTPVGGGIRSINVTLRKTLDLYACVRPVRYFPGITAPVREPEKINMVIFRENTEDLYSGIEFEAGSEKNKRFLTSFADEFPEEFQKIRFTDHVGIGLKPISQAGSERLIKAAINYAIVNNRKTVTLVHKGNIMKYTEGSFRNWGYSLAEEVFAENIYSLRQFTKTQKEKGMEAAKAEKIQALSEGKIWVNDVITDAAFQQLLLYPQDFDVLVATNLNGDYLSDAIAAQVGGIGIAPGANINYSTGIAIFEATHGTAPTIAGQDLANPSSMILSAEMMLRYIGWGEAADLVLSGLTNCIQAGYLTKDLGQFVSGATLVGTQAFAEEIIKNMNGEK